MLTVVVYIVAAVDDAPGDVFDKGERSEASSTLAYSFKAAPISTDNVSKDFGLSGFSFNSVFLFVCVLAMYNLH